MFGVQGVVMFIAVNIRLSDIERARRITAEKEAAAAAPAAGEGGGAAEQSSAPASGKRGATIVTRTTMGVERRREDI